MRLTSWRLRNSESVGLSMEVSRARRKRLHFGYGFGSLWTSAGNWSAFSCEDDGVGGGCGDSPESFHRGKGESEWRGSFGFNCRFGFGGGFWQRGSSGGSAGTAGRAEYRPGAADGARAEGGQQAIWRGGVGAVREAVGGAVAGADGGFLRDFCCVCFGERMEDAGGAP